QQEYPQGYLYVKILSARALPLLKPGKRPSTYACMLNLLSNLFNLFNLSFYFYFSQALSSPNALRNQFRMDHKDPNAVLTERYNDSVDPDVCNLPPNPFSLSKSF
ncbi:MAG: hypothetical protein Q8P67_20895, partial [archaeon]|nr:hypothetical protein [archaeon]